MKIPGGLCQREKATMRGWNRAGPPTRAIAGCRILARLRNSEGGALVEMALVLPVFMLVMTGIFSIGTAYSNQLTLTQAVGSGAQYLQQIRTSTTDPCSDTFTTIKNAAPEAQLSQYQRHRHHEWRHSHADRELVCRGSDEPCGGHHRFGGGHLSMQYLGLWILSFHPVVC